MFNSKVIFEQGASEVRVLSGGSITLAAGGQITGAFSGTPTISEGVTLTGGSLVQNSGTLQTIQSGGSFTFISTGVSSTAFVIRSGTSITSLNVGMDSPTYVAPAGALYVRSQGSMSGLWVNISQDATGSSWRTFQQGSAIG